MKKIISPITGKSKYLLIENCEFVSNIKISQELKESLSLSNGKAGTLLVKNLPGTLLNRENQNGRIYSTLVLEQAIREAKPLFETKQCLSQADEHPDGSFVAPTHASHVVTNAYIKKNTRVIVEGKEEVCDMLFMDIEVLNTVEGKNLRALLEAECSIGTSIRGVGDMEGKYVKNYEFLGIDFVGNPSSSTYTRMPVSESVVVAAKEEKTLNEAFTLTTTSTNVVKDLEQAASLQANLDSIGYGTVTKTSTKMDSEVDPKTGAQVTMVTLEAETSDDVSNLDQALSMAKNAMINPTVHIDSITIENKQEEGEKESVEGYVPEDEEGKKSLSEKDAGVIREAKEDKEEDPNLGKKFVLRTDRGFVTFDKNAIDFTDKPEDALHFTEGKEENGMVSMSKVTEILDAMGIFEIKKYFQNTTLNLGDGNKPVDQPKVDPEKPQDQPQEQNQVQPQVEQESGMSEENGSNTKYQAKVEIRNENGSEVNLIPVSAVDLSSALNEIANLWEMKVKSAGTNNVNITLTDTITGAQLRYNPESHNFEESCLTEDTEALDNIDEDILPEYPSYLLTVFVNNEPEELITVENRDNAINTMHEVVDKLSKWLYGQNADIKGQITGIVKGENGEEDYDEDHILTIYPNEPDMLDDVEESLEKPVEVKDNKVTTKLDDDTTIEKDFDSPIQAQVATAAVAQGKADPKVLVPEANVEEKLYNNPSEPSDELVQTPLKDATEDLLVTLYDIDWDFDKISEDLTPEDYKELVDILPDPWTIRLNAVDLEGHDDIYDIRKIILAKANEQAPWKINAAFVQKVEDANSGEVYYNNENETDIKPERDWSDDEHLDDVLAMYHNAGIDG